MIEKTRAEIGGIQTSARQIQRLAQKVGAGAQEWQERDVNSTGPQAPIMSVSGDATGLPMRKEEIEGVVGKQEDGSAKTAMIYGGCAFTQHKNDAEGTFRAKGFFIGSCVMEAGCNTVIGARCKQSGMFWSRTDAQNIVALRCIDASRRLDEF
jgi:hypothetical protein